jgi:hypothetical protein
MDTIWFFRELRSYIFVFWLDARFIPLQILQIDVARKNGSYLWMIQQSIFQTRTFLLHMSSSSSRYRKKLPPPHSVLGRLITINRRWKEWKDTGFAIDSNETLLKLELNDWKAGQLIFWSGSTWDCTLDTQPLWFSRYNRASITYN